MSTYDRIKAEAGPSPDYPRKGDFQTIYGYAGAEVLGTFPSVSDAKAAGARKTDSVVDEEACRAAKAKYEDFYRDISTKWYAAVRAEYPEVNDEVFALAHKLAYDQGHSSGYGEVELFLADYVEFAVKVIDATKVSA